MTNATQTQHIRHTQHEQIRDLIGRMTLPTALDIIADVCDQERQKAHEKSMKHFDQDGFDGLAQPYAKMAGQFSMGRDGLVDLANEIRGF